MQFTKEEIKWLEDEKKHLQFGNMLNELNQRVREYVGTSNLSIQEAQEQALIDFHNFIKSDEFIPTTSRTDFSQHIYFKQS